MHVVSMWTMHMSCVSCTHSSLCSGGWWWLSMSLICVVMCVKSHVMCELGWGSGASKLQIQVVSIGNMYDKWNLLCS